MSEALKPCQHRVIDERDSLNEKIFKLRDFMAGTIFHALPLEERRRLERQVHHMFMYRFVLDERIEAFGETNE